MQSNIYIKRDKDGKEEKHSLNIGGLNCFWHLQEVENGYILTCEDYRKEFASLDEVNKYFISLEEFLKSSEYVGKQFQRTMPLKDDDDCLDYNYTKANRYSMYLALYEKDGIFLKIFSFCLRSPTHSHPDIPHKLASDFPAVHRQTFPCMICLLQSPAI